MEVGGVGAITVFGNAYPGPLTQMVHLAAEGKIDEARKLDATFSEVCTLLFADGNPAGVKSLMAHQGKIGNNLRLPLAPACQEVDNAMLAAMRRLDSSL